MEKEKSKIPFNTLRKGAIASALGITIGLACFGFAGCSNGVDGKDGAQWYSGVDTPTTQGINGDFYLDTDDYILYQKTNGEWAALIQNFGKPGSNGTDGVTPKVEINTDGYWVINNIATNVKAKGEDGQPGSTPTISINAAGYWVINGEATETKAEAVNGTNGKDGNMWTVGESQPSTANTGDIFLNNSTWDIYQYNGTTWESKGNIKGAKGDQGSAGTAGATGATGAAGSSVYLGYDGYVWQDGTKTDFKVEKDATSTENVVEDTIGAYTTMKYFAGEYMALSSNRIALMANYQPTAKLTQYSGTQVTELQVVCERAGTLHIGTAKVSDIVTARTTGSTYTASTTSHSVVAGLNTIVFSTPLAVGADETIVIGGSSSTAKIYVAKSIPVADEQGNFALGNGSTNTSIISKTGNYADTLAIKIKATTSNIETAVFESITTDYAATKSSLHEVILSGAPYKYNDNSKIQGKTITKIGAIVTSNKAASGVQPYMTVYKCKANATSNFATSTGIKVYFPANTTANTWAYAECNIELADDETIAFGTASGDTLGWAYDQTQQTSQYNFRNNQGTSNNLQLLFDIYTSSTTTWAEHLDNLLEKENAAIKDAQVLALKTELQGKKFSILGDSISTFSGYSNDSTNTNSTIGSNAVYYSGSSGGITNVNETWWKQAADKTGMTVLVNNSYSGDKVTVHGQTRCEQLHDDTGNPNDSVINPDIIAVYLGINDFDTNVSADDFESSYDTMISKIVAKYNNSENQTSADIYLFTLLPNNMRINATALNAYNTAIREIAEKYGCTVVDLFADSGITTENVASYTGDTQHLHPNAAGMDKMTDCFWNALYENYMTDAD